MPAFTVALQDGTKVPCNAGQSVLEACLAAGLPMPYNCRSGECAECRAVLLSGSVDESPGADPAVFTAADRRKCRILTCLCAPTSDIALEIVLRDGAGAPRIEQVTAAVSRVERVSASVVQVAVDCPREIAYRAGQYFEWIVPGIAPNRYFSAATAPGGAELVFDIRIYPGGAVGGLVRSALAPGDPLELAGPYGHFGFTANGRRPAICVAGGAGLAPVKAMVEDDLARKSGRRIHLLYGARRQDDLYDTALLDGWAARSADFSYAVALSDEPEGSGWDGPRGPVTELLADTVFDGFGAEAFLCGPPAMIDAAMPVLEGIGVDPDDVYADRFSPAKR